MADEYVSPSSDNWTADSNSLPTDTEQAPAYDWSSIDTSGTNYASAIDQGFASFQQDMMGSDSALPGSGITTAGQSGVSELVNPFSGALKSIKDSLFDSKTGDLSKTGMLVGSAVISGLGELFSGAKKSAAQNAKQMADAYSQNAQTNANNSANAESARQNALTSTGTAFGPTSGATGIINAKYHELNKPNWKAA